MWDDYILVHKQYDKDKQVEHMVLQKKPIYIKKRNKYVVLTKKVVYFLKYFLL